MIAEVSARCARVLRRLAGRADLVSAAVHVDGVAICQVLGTAATGSAQTLVIDSRAELVVVGDLPDEVAVSDAREWLVDLFASWSLPNPVPGSAPQGAVLWRDLVSHQRDVVSVVRADGVVLFANQAAHDLFPDVPRMGEAVPTNLRRLHRDGSPMAAEDSNVAKSFRTGEPQQGVTGLALPGGDTRWFWGRTELLALDRVLAVTTDITAIIRAEDAAAASRSLVESIYRSITLGVLVVGPDLAVLEANPAALDILGCGLEDLRDNPGSFALGVEHPDGRPMSPEECPTARGVRGERVRDVLVSRAVRGGRRWLLVNAEPIAASRQAVVTFADVTAVQAARAEAEAASGRWRALVDNLSVGVAVFDPEGRVEEVNEAASGILGVNAAELVHGPLAVRRDGTVVDENGAPLRVLPSQRCRETGRPVLDEIVGYVLPNQPIRWLLVAAAPLPGGRALLSLRDFTVVRNAAHEIERRQSEFISTLSHELRTPLTSLDGALALLQAGLGGVLPGSGGELLAVARRSAGRLIRIVNDVLDLERIAAGVLSISLSTLAVHDLVADAVELARPHAAGRRIAVRAPPEAELWALADAHRVSQILANFLANAIHFSPDAGEVRTELVDTGEYIRIRVVDGGSGVPTWFRPRLFTRFAQAGDPSGRAGAGLGLSICKALAGALGGEVGYEPVAAGGSVFWLDLPRAHR